MAVLINFKICDNAEECSGIEVCPTGALAWDKVNETIVIDNEKCISCGMCEKECPIGAIRVAHDENEYNEIKKEIDDDSRNTKDLFVDRYGAAGISDFFKIEKDEIADKIEKYCLTLIEVYNLDFAECLLKSIPIKELTKDFPDDTLYYKADVDEDFKDYEVSELPALLIFKNNELLGHIDGYYNIDSKNDMLEKIENVVNK